MLSDFFWAGSEQSFHDYQQEVMSVLERHGSIANLRLNMIHNGVEEDEDSNPVGYQVAGNVALIGIEGPTIDKSNWFSQMLGIASYEDIKVRLSQAHEDDSVKSTMLLIDSPGGMVSGVHSLSRFIYDFNTNVMPVVSYNLANQYSAAVLYGSAAGQMIADEETSIGSIGVIAIHKEITERMRREGIKATVFRSAPYKGLGNPYEKLSEKASDEINKQVSVEHNKFVNVLATNTGNSIDAVAGWATGKTFSAEDALGMELLDSIQPLEHVIAKLNEKLQNTNRKSA